MYLKTKQLPAILQNALSSVGYKRADIEVSVKSEVSIHGLGGAGYRDFAVLINLETGESKRHNGSWGGANMFNPSNSIDLDTSMHTIPIGGAVILGSEGGGSPVSATIYVSSQNVFPALNEPKLELSQIEMGVLKVYDSIRGGVRQDYLTGYKTGRGHYLETPLTATGLIYVQDHLKSMGLIKVTKSGGVSITTEGKNCLLK